MKGMVFKNQPGALRFGQTSLDEGQITILVAAVKFVADDGMAEMREMDAELVLATGAGDEAEEREGDFTKLRRAKWKVEVGDWVHSFSSSSASSIFRFRGRWTRTRRRTIKSTFNKEIGLRRRAVGADAILDGNNALFVLAER